MDRNDLLKRTKDFALRIIKLVSALPKDRLGDILGRQILKSGTSVGANYREALRASSKRHFTTTIEIAEREADETLYWLELLFESAIIKPTRLSALMKENQELLRILSATAVTSKRRGILKKSEIRNQKS